jgi:hypothetical protein
MSKNFLRKSKWKKVFAGVVDAPLKIHAIRMNRDIVIGLIISIRYAATVTTDIMKNH